MEYQERDGIYTQHLIIPWYIKVEMGSIHNILLSMEYEGRDGIYTQHLIIPWNIKVQMGSIHNILLSHGRWDLYTTSYYPMEYHGRDGIYTYTTS